MNLHSAGCFLDRPPFVRFWAPFYNRLFAPYLKPVLLGGFWRSSGKATQMGTEIAQLTARVDHLSRDSIAYPTR